MKRALPFMIIGLVLVAAVGVAAMLWRDKNAGKDSGSVLVSEEKSSPAPASNGTEAESDGPADFTKPNVKVSSPVVLEEYGDYQCPPCGVLYPVIKELEREYGNQLRVVFHHFPIPSIHKNAIAAARAAEAARNQNKFWEMHDRLYRNQKAWNELENPRDVFISYARELGLSADQFNRDMDSNQVEQRIQAEVEEAQARGIKATPTIYLDGYELRFEYMNPQGLRRGINQMLLRRAASK